MFFLQWLKAELEPDFRLFIGTAAIFRLFFSTLHEKWTAIPGW